MTTEFLSDILGIRERARRHMEKGAVTAGYSADIGVILRILNEALASEIVCVLRYKRHYYMATGIHAQAVAAEFLEHANEEQGHADLLASRITQLGGSPDFNPAGLVSRSHSEYVEGNDLLDMIREDLVAERIAIEFYGEMVRYVGEADPTTRRMLEGILRGRKTRRGSGKPARHAGLGRRPAGQLRPSVAAQPETAPSTQCSASCWPSGHGGSADLELTVDPARSFSSRRIARG
jgi:bacterioferritin